MNYLKKASLIGIIVLLQLTFIFSNIGFYGQSISTQTINSQEPIDVNFNLVNREDIVKSQIEIIYELRRESDLSLMYQSSEELSFAPFEVKQIQESLSFGLIPEGEYILTTQIRSGAGTPLGRVSNEIKVNSNLGKNVEFTTLPYLRVFYDYGNRVRYENSYSNTGRPTGQNENFEVRFELENLDNTEQLYKYDFSVRNSYDSQDEMDIIFSNTTLLNINEKKEIIETISYDKAGTYDLFVSVYDEEDNLVANKEVRLVIVGEDGTILDVFNKQDTYEKDEFVTVDVSIVGPADSLSIVENSNLIVDVLQNNESIYTEQKQIEILPINPLDYNFFFQAPVKLEYYTLRITLEKDGKIYDQVELDYEPLDPELVISPKGAIYDPSLNMCLDDGECSEKEKQIGNCADCIIEENNKMRDELKETRNDDEDRITIEDEFVENGRNNSQLFSIISVSALIIFGGIAIYYVISNTRRIEK